LAKELDAKFESEIEWEEFLNFCDFPFWKSMCLKFKCFSFFPRPSFWNLFITLFYFGS
jgi:hypothetical protein